MSARDPKADIGWSSRGVMTNKFGISQPVRRSEDRRFIAGMGSFADDINAPGQAHAIFLRSSHGHGLIRAIHTEKALSGPGILAVITGEDLRAAGVGYIPYLPLGGFTMDPPADTPRPALAQDRVRHVGEPIVLVVAETVAQAIDACEKVLVEIEPLPAVTDVERAIVQGAATVWPDAPNNVALTWRHGDRAAVEFRLHAGRSCDDGEACQQPSSCKSNRATQLHRLLRAQRSHFHAYCREPRRTLLSPRPVRSRLPHAAREDADPDV